MHYIIIELALVIKKRTITFEEVYHITMDIIHSFKVHRRMDFKRNKKTDIN